MGYVDVHVHPGPDIVPRWAGDLAVVRAYAEAGFSACVLKSHVESTVGRAAGAAAALRAAPDASAGGDGPAVFGGVALNGSVGGFNPNAVAAALAEGGKVIWLPTQDAHTQDAARLPRLCHTDSRLDRRTYMAPPLDPGATSALRAIFDMIAEADAVLATGHLGVAEVRWVVENARAAGVRRLLLTHPSYTVPAMSAAEARELADAGALVEVTALQLFHQPGQTAEALAAYIRDVGPERVVLSSDAGQPESPPPPEALHRLIDALAAAGLDRAALRAAASEIPAGLLF